MNVLIIEDEKPASNKLKVLLHHLDSNIKVLDTIETVEDSINWLKNNPKPQLIFADIQLSDGISFEIFETIKINVPIIFTTAYDKYAINAFKVNSIDYLLKPIENNALKAALDKYNQFFSIQNLDNQSIASIYGQLDHTIKNRFFVKVGMHYKSILTQNIECFYLKERSCFLQTFEGRSYDIDYSLEQLQNLLDPNIFFRINRNYIIHIDSITNIQIYSTNRLKLKIKNIEDSDDFIVSRDKVSLFKQWLGQ